MRKLAIRSALEALYFTGASHLLEQLCQGIGTILTLHHVRPARMDAFQPNRFLEITPEYLDDALGDLARRGFECISLDEMYRRYQLQSFKRKFVCITFDDGYRDNLEYAYPVLKHHQTPFTIYVATSFPDRRGTLWWYTLETIVAANGRVAVPLHDGVKELVCETIADKLSTLDILHSIVCSLPSDDRLHAFVADLAERASTPTKDLNKDLCMSWDELATLAADPLCTIGAHTVSHPRLRKLPDHDARREMLDSAARIEEALGIRPTHFAYPFGDVTAAGPREFSIARKLGFKTAVTTRPGVLFQEHREHLTALPRISLNGEFQRLRYLRVLTSGVATAAANRFRKVNAGPKRGDINLA